MADYPLRLRFHGGRHTHAARIVNGDEEDRTVTACGYMTWPKDEAKPDDAAITCRACAKELTR
jgi:hypothetical protein